MQSRIKRKHSYFFCCQFQMLTSIIAILSLLIISNVILWVKVSKNSILKCDNKTCKVNGNLKINDLETNTIYSKGHETQNIFADLVQAKKYQEKVNGEIFKSCKCVNP